MKLFQLLVVLSLLSLSACSSKFPAETYLGKKVRSFSATSLEGTKLAVPNSRGASVLFFWASWCGSSLSRIEKYQDLAEEIGRRNPRVDFYAVNIDEYSKLSKVEEVIRSKQLDAMTHIFSGNDVDDLLFRAFKGDRVPFIAVVACDGTLSYVGDDFGEVPEALATCN
jgi:thiol-disulfide isomerase/thioredoxin